MNDTIKFDNKYILCGYGFKEESPYLLLDSLSKPTTRYYFFVRNVSFTLTSYKTRYCVGKYDMLTFQDEPCSSNALLTSKDIRCQDCNQAIGFNPAFYNASSQISAKQQVYNSQKHCIYLAYFDKKLIKVGISHYKRTITRLCEQGARAAAIIYEYDNAYKARGAEAMIIKDLKLPEAVSNSKKMKLISETFDYADAKEKLTKLSGEFHRQINSTTIKSPEIYNFQQHYLAENTLKGDIFDVSKVSPISISGKCIGMIGNILITEQQNQQFMVPIKLLISHTVTFSEKIIKNKIVPTQMSLF